MNKMRTIPLGFGESTPVSPNDCSRRRFPFSGGSEASSCIINSIAIDNSKKKKKMNIKINEHTLPEGWMKERNGIKPKCRLLFLFVGNRKHPFATPPPMATKSQRFGVICAGCACLDLFLLQSEILPTRESLALVGSTSFTPGCATSNTGRALAGIYLHDLALLIIFALTVIFRYWSTCGNSYSNWRRC